jgi:hypothetical protein
MGATHRVCQADGPHLQPHLRNALQRPSQRSRPLVRIDLGIFSRNSRYYRRLGIVTAIKSNDVTRFRQAYLPGRRCTAPEASNVARRSPPFGSVPSRFPFSSVTRHQALHLRDSRILTKTVYCRNFEPAHSAIKVDNVEMGCIKGSDKYSIELPGI